MSDRPTKRTNLINVLYFDPPAAVYCWESLDENVMMYQYTQRSDERR